MNFMSLMLMFLGFHPILLQLQLTLAGALLAPLIKEVLLLLVAAWVGEWVWLHVHPSPVRLKNEHNQ